MEAMDNRTDLTNLSKVQTYFVNEEKMKQENPNIGGAEILFAKMKAAFNRIVDSFVQFRWIDDAKVLKKLDREIKKFHQTISKTSDLNVNSDDIRSRITDMKKICELIRGTGSTKNIQTVENDLTTLSNRLEKKVQKITGSVDLENTYKTSNEKLESVQLELKKKNDFIKTKEQEVQQQLEEVNNLKEEIEKMKFQGSKTLEDAQINREEISRQNNELLEKASTAEEAAKKAIASEEKLTQELSELTVKIAEIEHTHGERLSKATHGKEQLQTSKRALNKELSALKEESELLKKELKSAKDLVTTTTDNNIVLRKQVEESRKQGEEARENKALVAQWRKNQETVVGTFENKIKNLQKSENELTQKINDLTTQLAQANKTAAGLEPLKSSQNQLQAELIKAKEEVAELHDKISEKNPQLGKALKELDHKKAELDQANTEKSSLELQLKSKISEYEILSAVTEVSESDLKTEKSQSEIHTKNTQKLTKDNQKLIEILDTKINDLSEELSDANKKIENLEKTKDSSITELTQQLKAKEEKIQEMETHSKKVIETISSSHEQLESLKKELEILKTEKLSNRHELSKLKDVARDLEISKKEVAGLKQISIEAAQLREKAGVVIDTLSSKTTNLEKSEIELTQKINDLTKQLEQSTKTLGELEPLKSSQNQLQAELTKAKKEVDELHDKISEKDPQLGKALKELDHKKAELDQAHTEKSSLELQLQNKISAYEILSTVTDVSEFELKSEKSRSEINTKDSQKLIEILDTKINDLNEELLSANKKIKNLEKTKDSSITELTQQLEAKEGKIQEMETHSKEVIKTISSSHEQLKSVKNQLEDLKKERQDLHSEKLHNQDEISKLNNAVKKLKSNQNAGILELSKKLEELEQKNENLLKESKEVQEEAESKVLNAQKVLSQLQEKNKALQEEKEKLKAEVTNAQGQTVKARAFTTEINKKFSERDLERNKKEEILLSEKASNEEKIKKAEDEVSKLTKELNELKILKKSDELAASGLLVKQAVTESKAHEKIGKLIEAKTKERLEHAEDKESLITKLNILKNELAQKEAVLAKKENELQAARHDLNRAEVFAVNEQRLINERIELKNKEITPISGEITSESMGKIKKGNTKKVTDQLNSLIENKVKLEDMMTARDAIRLKNLQDHQKIETVKQLTEEINGLLNAINDSDVFEKGGILYEKNGIKQSSKDVFEDFFNQEDPLFQNMQYFKNFNDVRNEFKKLADNLEDVDFTSSKPLSETDKAIVESISIDQVIDISRQMISMARAPFDDLILPKEIENVLEKIQNTCEQLKDNDEIAKNIMDNEKTTKVLINPKKRISRKVVVPEGFEIPSNGRKKYEDIQHKADERAKGIGKVKVPEGFEEKFISPPIGKANYEEKQQALANEMSRTLATSMFNLVDELYKKEGFEKSLGKQFWGYSGDSLNLQELQAVLKNRSSELSPLESRVICSAIADLIIGSYEQMGAVLPIRIHNKLIDIREMSDAVLAFEKNGGAVNPEVVKKMQAVNEKIETKKAEAEQKIEQEKAEAKVKLELEKETAKAPFLALGTQVQKMIKMANADFNAVKLPTIPLADSSIFDTRDVEKSVGAAKEAIRMIVESDTKVSPPLKAKIMEVQGMAERLKNADLGKHKSSISAEEKNAIEASLSVDGQYEYDLHARLAKFRKEFEVEEISEEQKKQILEELRAQDKQAIESIEYEKKSIKNAKKLIDHVKKFIGLSTFLMTGSIKLSDVKNTGNLSTDHSINRLKELQNRLISKSNKPIRAGDKKLVRDIAEISFIIKSEIKKKIGHVSDDIKYDLDTIRDLAMKIDVSAFDNTYEMLRFKNTLSNRIIKNVKNITYSLLNDAEFADKANFLELDRLKEYQDEIEMMVLENASAANIDDIREKLSQIIESNYSDGELGKIPAEIVSNIMGLVKDADNIRKLEGGDERAAERAETIKLNQEKLKKSTEGWKKTKTDLKLDDE